MISELQMFQNIHQINLYFDLTKFSWKLQWIFSLGIAMIHLKSIAIPREKSHCNFHGKFTLHYKILPYCLFSKPCWNSFCKNLKLALNLLSLSSLDLYSGMRLGKSSCDKSENPQNVKRTQNILYLYHPSVVWTIHCDR